MTKNHFKIALTGGPGGGKTTAAHLFRRELGESIVVVPESATILFQGGFPRHSDQRAREACQRAIYHVQKELENAQQALYPHRTLLCDRGTIDGAAYWPHGEDSFFEEMGSTLEKEFSNYDAVVFFETAAASERTIEGGNPQRVEDQAQALLLDERLKNIWSKHPRFYFIKSQDSFLSKMNEGLDVLIEIVEEITPKY